MQGPLSYFVRFVELLPAETALPLGIASHAVQGPLSYFVRLLTPAAC
ncbi:hypothetical protein [Paenibacillus solani]|nr:hypothetical protein [Paenibacillus solani]